VEPIGQTHLPRGLLFLNRSQSLLRRRQLTGQSLAAGDQLGSIRALALGHPDRLGVRIALRAQTIHFDLERLALFFERTPGLDIEGEAAARHVTGDGFGV